MLNQIVLESTMRIFIPNSHTYLQYPIKSMNWPLTICIQWGRRAPLVIVVVMAALVRVPLILNNHIMHNNASIHDLTKSSCLPHTRWCAYNGKTRLQHPKCALNIFSC